eukprot:scpid62776/ scgid14875/ 
MIRSHTQEIATSDTAMERSASEEQRTPIQAERCTDSAPHQLENQHPLPRLHRTGINSFDTASNSPKQQGNTVGPCDAMHLPPPLCNHWWRETVVFLLIVLVAGAYKYAALRSDHSQSLEQLGIQETNFTYLQSQKDKRVESLERDNNWLREKLDSLNRTAELRLNKAHVCEMELTAERQTLANLTNIMEDMESQLISCKSTIITANATVDTLKRDHAQETSIMTEVQLKKLLKIAHVYASNFEVLKNWILDTLEFVGAGSQTQSRLYALVQGMETLKDQAIRYLKAGRFRFPDGSIVRAYAEKLPVNGNVGGVRSFIRTLRSEYLNDIWQVREASRSVVSAFFVGCFGNIVGFSNQPFVIGRLCWKGLLWTFGFYASCLACFFFSDLNFKILIHTFRGNGKMFDLSSIRSKAFLLDLLWTIVVFALIATLIPVCDTALTAFSNEAAFLIRIVFIAYCFSQGIMKEKYALILLKSPSICRRNWTLNNIGLQRSDYLRVLYNRRYFQRFQPHALRRNYA